MMLAVLVCAAAPWKGGAESPMVLWPDGAPGALGQKVKDIPTLTPYMPESEKGVRAAVIVCPGGGYRGLADYEGKPVAEWLNTLGIAGFVLKYRLGPDYHHPVPLQDAARAIRTVRANAKEWGIRPDKIGILGFSAGGHLASTAGTHFGAGNPQSPDPIERVSSRPDAMILIYPVISMGPEGHGGSREALLGPNPPHELIALLSNELQATKETPPAFLVHGTNDKAVSCENSLMFADALRKAGVENELHLFERGPHGFGLGLKEPNLVPWTGLCADWLKRHDFVPSPSSQAKP